MNEETTETQKVSSVVDKSVEPLEESQYMMPTMGVIIALFIAFFVLKTFIYKPKDGYRDGK